MGEMVPIMKWRHNDRFRWVWPVLGICLLFLPALFLVVGEPVVTLIFLLIAFPMIIILLSAYQGIRNIVWRVIWRPHELVAKTIGEVLSREEISFTSLREKRQLPKSILFSYKEVLVMENPECSIRILKDPSRGSNVLVGPKTKENADLVQRLLDLVDEIFPPGT